jgi:putative ABC transport system permease protein
MLFRKMLRDMKLNRTQFISIFIMAFLGVFVYSGISSEWNGLKETSEKYYEDTNLADAIIYGTQINDEAAGSVRKIEGVTGVERRMALTAIGEYENKPALQLHFVEKFEISRFQLMEGEEFSLEKDGIWLDQLFAREMGLKPGDRLVFTVYGITFEPVIRGLILSPEYVYYAGTDDMVPNRKNYGFGYLSYQTVPEGMPVQYTQLLVTSGSGHPSDLEGSVDQALDGKYSVYLARENMRSYMQFNEEIKEHQAMGKIFPIVFLAVAVLTMVTTMSRLVNNQRTQIGVLKAVGFRRRQILFHYISYGLWISLLGTVLGTILGPMLLPYLFYGPLQTAYMLPEWNASMPVAVLYMAEATILSCTLATYLICRNVLKDTPAQSLRPKAPSAVRHNLLDRSRLWSKLSFHSQWNLRDVLRCKGRSAMAVAGILGCSALLICGFGLQDTMDYIVKWNYEVINRYQTRIQMEDTATQEQIATVIKKVSGEGSYEEAVEIKSKGMKKSGELLVVEEDAELIGFVDSDRNRIKLPKDRISISYKMAENLKLQVGDEIEWHRYGEEEWNRSTIGAVYRMPFAQGIAMYRGVYESYGYRYQPTAILSAGIPSKNYPAEGEEGVAKIMDKEELISGYQTMAQAMDVLVYTLMLAAIILAVVVIYNLGVLSFTERQRELSTLKVMGFKTGKLRRLLLTQNIWLTVIGILPGIPLGTLILRYIFRFIGDVFDFIIVIDLSSYLGCILGTLLLSAAVNRFFSKRVKSIDMVSSLKGVE